MDALTAATWSEQSPSLSAVTICFTTIIILSNKPKYWQTSDFSSHSDTNASNFKRSASDLNNNK